MPGVTASTREEFARSERRVVGDMSTDIVRAMILVGFVIGVAVAGLVAYSATLAQLRDYAVLRALGLRARARSRSLSPRSGDRRRRLRPRARPRLGCSPALLPRLTPTLVLAIRAGDVAQAFAVAAGVAPRGAAFPVLRVARVDPASVFRR